MVVPGRQHQKVRLGEQYTWRGVQRYKQSRSDEDKDEEEKEKKNHSLV